MIFKGHEQCGSSGDSRGNYSSARTEFDIKFARHTDLLISVAQVFAERMGTKLRSLVPRMGGDHVLSIINDYSDRHFRSEHERFEVTMRTIQGSLVVSSFLNSFIGFSLNGHLLLSSPRLVLITLLNSKLIKQSCRTERSFLMSSAPWIPIPVSVGCMSLG
ncbi:nucleobase-ascorbate transporter 3-like isoform X2 [Pyrus communis]|uniref:nucleobase-ascorbate transporter 3-like isoform X2 n=1 Tax=Pyrus communis TaxID=23211 RepID=UPI0035C23040